MLRASIDIGSNSILLLIANITEKGFEEFVNESRVTSLGKNIDINKNFSENSIKASREALKDYSKIISRYNLSSNEVLVTATEASRVAKNSSGFFQSIEKDFGLKVTIISGAGEAYYVANGVVNTLKEKRKEEDRLSIMDIGGASTEFINVRTNPFKVLKSTSLPMGSIRCNDWIEQGTFEEKIREILSNAHLFKNFSSKHMICVAGAMTSLGAMIKGLSAFKSDEVNGVKISFLQFEEFVASIISLNPTQLLREYPFLKKRSETILTGARIALEIGRLFGVETFEISTLGLRYGTILEGSIREDFIEKGI